MVPALTIGEIPFYDTPTNIEGSPYWVDLWTDINGYKIGLQIKPSTYKSANASLYMGKTRSTEEQGHRAFRKKFGGKVFIVTPSNGTVPPHIEQQIIEEKNLLLSLPAK